MPFSQNCWRNFEMRLPCSLYRGHRFPAEVIAHAVWLYSWFPLSLRMVEDIARCPWNCRQLRNDPTLGGEIRPRIRQPRPTARTAIRRQMVAINGTKHWLWRAVDQNGFVLDALVQSRRDKQVAERLLRKLIHKQARPPRVMITDKLGAHTALRARKCG